MKYFERSLLLRLYSNRSDMEQVFILSTLTSIGLISFRVIYTGDLHFVFLVWNLFLAIIPYSISKKMGAIVGSKSKWKFFLYSFVWLLFIPNSFYINTDLFHLDLNDQVPLWYDLALLLSFAWSGVLFGILSVRQMEKEFENYFTKKFDLLFIVPVMFLNALGIYVGRYLRFNSWDVLTNPFQLTQDIIYLFVHPIRNRFDWSLSICYTILLTVICYTIKKLSRVL